MCPQLFITIGPIVKKKHWEYGHDDKSYPQKNLSYEMYFFTLLKITVPTVFGYNAYIGMKISKMM